MAYDPVKALLAAGVFSEPLPNSVREALSGINQDEVDLIISAHSRDATDGASNSWCPPNARQSSGDVSTRCACGLWSGSGQGAEA